MASVKKSTKERRDVLADTFFKRNLLFQDPNELRDELLGSHRDPDSAWAIVDNLLWVIEDEATKVLKANGVPLSTRTKLIASVVEEPEDNHRQSRSFLYLDSPSRDCSRPAEIDRLQKTVLDLHGCDSRHLGSIRIKETFQDLT